MEAELLRLRRAIGFERLLARLFATQDSNCLLKGGYALEVRFQVEARATRDLDLTIPNARTVPKSHEGLMHAVEEQLRAAATRQVDQYFSFRVGQQMQDLDGAPYGGARYPVSCMLDGRVYIEFHVDIGVGDAISATPEWADGHDLLGFAGIPPARIGMIPLAVQIAEKFHAYTVPRPGGVNTRVRDLVDLVLLIRRGVADAKATRAAIKSTFSKRATHAIAADLPPPPDDWAQPYKTFVQQIPSLPAELNQAYAIVRDFWKETHA